MDKTPKLQLPYIQSSQAQKHITHNEAIRVLDALIHLSVLSNNLSSPPNAPHEGDRYIIGTNSTNEWLGEENQIAAWQDGIWIFYTPQKGWVCWVEDENILLAFDGSDWVNTAAGNTTSVNPISFVGVNATADSTNRLSVNSPATLFNHEGAGHQLKVNKSTNSDTASLLFQTNFSGRAEFGLTGDDDFHMKVSPDGSTFYDSIVIDKDTGFASYLHTNPPKGPMDVRAGAIPAQTIAGRSIAIACTYAQTTSGRAGFTFENTNNYLPSGNAGNSTFQFLYPFDEGGDAGYKVFRIAKGTTLSDTFWINVDGGAVFGSPSGGDKGGGAINAEAVYDDNSLLSCYVFDQYLDQAINLEKWDKMVPDKCKPDQFTEITDENGKTILNKEDGLPVMAKFSEGEKIEKRIHAPLRKFKARIGSDYDPLTLDGYSRHWREKRHLSAMPNEREFDPINNQLTTGEWIQRLVETVETQAILIEELNSRLKTIECHEKKLL